jgi:hypothetical protein
MMAGSWWIDPKVQADRAQFEAQAAERETALRNDKRFGQPTLNVNVITATDERGMFAEYRKDRRTRQAGPEAPKVVARAKDSGVDCGQPGSAAKFIAAIRARAGKNTAGTNPAPVEDTTTDVGMPPTPEAAPAAGDTKMITANLKGTNKYATVYLIPGVPGQLMIRNLLVDGAEPPATISVDIDPSLLRPVDEKVAQREAKRAERESKAEERATKAAERAAKAAERAKKAQELADRIKAKRAGGAPSAEPVEEVENVGATE